MPVPSAWDEVLYPGGAWPYTHPDRLAVVARLHGLTPAPVDACRVLEVGCGDGHNLVPMAHALPGSRFVGIDIVEDNLEVGRELARDVGVDNVELRRVDLMEPTEALGAFDYIIAHGVYSWVPAPVRDGLLALIGAQLSPGGVAYVNYNARPGGHVRAMLREMMQFHVRGFEDRARQANQAVALVKFLADASPAGSPYRGLLEEELHRLTGYPPEVIHHDDLSPVNHAASITEIVDAASAHGLAYLGEARAADVRLDGFPPAVRRALEQLGSDRVRTEQYVDFLVCRKYRRTLLCRAQDAPSSEPRPAALEELRVTSAGRSEPERFEVDDRSPVTFAAPGSPEMETDDPFTKAVLASCLEAWPRSVAFRDLLARARRRRGRSSPDDAEDAQALLLACHGVGLVELRTTDGRLAGEPGETPIASALARRQLERGPRVTSLRHEPVDLDDELAPLLRLLDGTRSREALRAALSLDHVAVDRRLSRLVRLALIEG